MKINLISIARSERSGKEGSSRPKSDQLFLFIKSIDNKNLDYIDYVIEKYSNLQITVVHHAPIWSCRSLQKKLPNTIEIWPDAEGDISSKFHITSYPFILALDNKYMLKKISIPISGIDSQTSNR